jgi:hypothetical protein
MTAGELYKITGIWAYFKGETTEEPAPEPEPEDGA